MKKKLMIGALIFGCVELLDAFSKGTVLGADAIMRDYAGEDILTGIKDANKTPYQTFKFKVIEKFKDISIKAFENRIANI